MNSVQYQRGFGPAALELLRPGGEQGPDFRQLPVPGPRGGVQVAYDPIAAASTVRRAILGKPRYIPLHRFPQAVAQRSQ